MIVKIKAKNIRRKKTDEKKIASDYAVHENHQRKIKKKIVLINRRFYFPIFFHLTRNWSEIFCEAK